MAKEELEEFAHRSIIRMILDHRFKPGDFLLETQLADIMRLSRTPVRQALGRLVAEGFLEKRKKRGCYIPLPDAEDAKQVFFARQAIESQTAAAAALHATEKDTQELYALLQKQDEVFAAFDKEAYSVVNEQFHLGIAKASRNVYLERYCRHVFWRSNVYIFFFDAFYTTRSGENGRHFTPQQHKEIVDAIAGRDPDKAKDAMIRHIQNTYSLLFKPWEVT